MTSRPSLSPGPVAEHRPVGYFVHHHGHGHARRCVAITRELHPRPVTIFCARPEIFPWLPANAEIITIPDFHGKQARSAQLHEQPACVALDCAPVGVSAIRGTGTTRPITLRTLPVPPCSPLTAKPWSRPTGPTTSASAPSIPAACWIPANRYQTDRRPDVGLDCRKTSRFLSRWRETAVSAFRSRR